MILVNISVTKNQITKIVVTNRVELAPDQAGIHARNNPLMLRGLGVLYSNRMHSTIHSREQGVMVEI